MNNQCVFVILPVGSTPKKTLTNYSFKGKVIKAQQFLQGDA